MLLQKERDQPPNFFFRLSFSLHSDISKRRKGIRNDHTMSSSEVNKAMVEELEKGGSVEVSSTDSSADKHLTRKVLWKLDTRFEQTISLAPIPLFSN